MGESGLKRDIIKNHPPGFKGILSNYGPKKMLLSFPFIGSVVLAITWTLATYNADDLNYKDVLGLVDFVIGIFPSLLGFNLGGYALLIGFGNTNLIKSMTRPMRRNRTSLFQLISAVFAFSILLQAGVLIGAILILQFTTIGIHTVITPKATALINSMVFFIVAFICLWALLILPYVITNLFSFGQVHHLHLTKQRLEEEESAKRQKGQARRD